jgi:CRISPR type I-A-associated protein Csa5
MMSELEEKPTTEKYRGVANQLALLAIATGSYTHLDRLANALNPETVYRVMYDVNRNIQVLNTRSDVSIKKDEKEYQGRTRDIWVLEKTGQDGNNRRYEFWFMPRDEDLRLFIEEASRDLSVARKLAAYSSSLVAIKIL